jgi:hypothetical protein
MLYHRGSSQDVYLELKDWAPEVFERYGKKFSYPYHKHLRDRIARVIRQVRRLEDRAYDLGY